VRLGIWLGTVTVACAGPPLVEFRDGACQPTAQQESDCGDGLDDDCDGLTDCDDTDCEGLACGASKICAGSACTDCGSPGQTCCEANTCDVGIACLEPTSTCTRPAPFDFDGDGKTDLAVFRPDDNLWLWRESYDGTDQGQTFGSAGDIPLVADFTGDGKADQTTFTPSTGFWSIVHSEDRTTFFGFPFGQSGDRPLAGDYDGNGIDDVVVVRPQDPDAALWIVALMQTEDFIYDTWGLGEDWPMGHDFDGDGRADFGLFRQSNGTWWRRMSTDGELGAPFGTSEDVAVAADYTGDGRVDLATFTPATGAWSYLNEDLLSSTDFVLGHGGDIPVPCDYDGDRVADAGVFRPSTGEWIIELSTGGTLTVTFGQDGDIPVPSLTVGPW
jgi:hypothetical protein